MMLRRLLVLGFLPIATLVAQAQTGGSAEILTAHLKNASLLHVDFTQTRNLAALSRPLKTTGAMVLSKEHGVIWQVRKPLNLSYVIGPKGMVEVGPDGKAKRKAAQDVPMVAQMARILQALLQGRWSGLEEYFTVRAEGKSERWKISLSPRSNTAGLLKGVQVSGGRFIESIRVEEPSGDGMDLAFERPNLDAPLSEAELRLFSFQ